MFPGCCQRCVEVLSLSSTSGNTSAARVDAEEQAGSRYAKLTDRYDAHVSKFRLTSEIVSRLPSSYGALSIDVCAALISSDRKCQSSSGNLSALQNCPAVYHIVVILVRSTRYPKTFMGFGSHQSQAWWPVLTTARR